MSNLPPARNHDPPGKPASDPTTRDDMSEVTAPQGKPPNENKHVMATKVLKFSFVYDAKTKHGVAPNVIHTHWLQTVQETLGTEIIIFNNLNQHVETVSTLKWSDPKIHQKQFKLYQKSGGRDEKRNTTYFFLHRVQTDVTVAKIKSLPSVKSLMKEYNFYISDHQWSETEWETTRIGFVTNIDPSFYNRTQAHNKFNELLATFAAATKGKKPKVPQFRMAFSSPQVRHESHTVSTKAYAIEVMQENAAPMLEALSVLLRDKPNFVPYNLRRKFPGGYEKAIRYQSHLLMNTMVVILQNISSDMMFYLQPYIMAVSGVRDMVANPKPHDTGRYSLLVDKDKFESVRATLKHSLHDWIETHVEIDAQPTEYQFSGPARVKPLYDDGLSSGENSWMTQSNASFMSIVLPPDQEQDFFKASMKANKIFTFEDFPSTSNDNQSSNNLPATSETSKPAAAWGATEATSELTDTEQSQRKEIEQLKAERDEQRAEIEALKKQRIQDQAEREKAAAEAKQTQSQAVNQIRDDLRIEMKLMMDQFRASLGVSMQSDQSNKRSGMTTPPPDNDMTDNSPSEKRQDVRPTPEKLFPSNVNLRDSNQEISDAMDADVSQADCDHDL